MTGSEYTAPAEQIYGTKEHPYSTLPETKEEGLLWADLEALDLSKFDQPGGKEELAKQLKHAVHTIGFFYIVNFGFTQEEVDEQFGIGKEIFDLPFEEKAKYAADHANGGYNGYTGPELEHFKKTRAQGSWTRSNIEVYNIPKFTKDFEDQQKNHPQPVTDNWDTIVKFGKAIHTNVIEKLLVIFALVLELPDENYFASRHNYEAKSEDHLRYMKYKARAPEVNETNALYTGGHTDLGSVTLLFRQPIAALQVLGGDGIWRWVKPLKGSITVNIADTLQILSGTYLKSSVHRVATPPKDQTQYDRLGVLYFVRPNNDVLVEAVKNSPVLQREHIYEKVADEEKAREPLTVERWVQERQKHIFSQSAAEKYAKTMTDTQVTVTGGERKELETVVAGVKVKYWK